MTCADVRRLMLGHRDGDLDPPMAERVEAHLASCATCVADVEAARALRPLVARLPRSLAPDHDLWVGIRPRLRPLGRGRVVMPVWAMATAALGLVLLGAAAMWALTNAGQGGTRSGFAEVEARYVQTTATIAADYADAAAALSPATRAVIERNLNVIDQALGETLAALANDPSNRTLESLVLAAYQRKIEFLERIASIEQDG